MQFSSQPITNDLEGAILAHSITAGGKSFKKGRHLSFEDIHYLRTAGTTEVMVAILDIGDVHENKAAEDIALSIIGKNLHMSTAFTGRVNLFAKSAGVCVFNIDKLKELNRIDESITVASIANHEVVQAKQMIATIKIIPFSVPEKAIKAATELVTTPLVDVHSFSNKEISLIQTFHEGTKHSVLDKTADILGKRLSSLTNECRYEVRCQHTSEDLAAEIDSTIKTKAPDILIIAGASAITDRADVIPHALELSGGHVQRFGMPVDPGNLLMLGMIGTTKVIGMPGCARSPKLNGFDWVLQRLLADIHITNEDISDMAIGGLLKEIPSRPLPRASTSSPEKTTIKQPKIIAVILAAGQSRRMGKENKLLKKIKGSSMVRHSVDTIKASKIAEIIVVTGHEKSDIELELKDVASSFTYNPLYNDGISSSLKAGITALPDDCDGALVCLGDMPLVTPKDIQQLISAFDPAIGRAICVPTFKEKWGNPVLIGRQFFSEIQYLSGDIGARHLISEYPDFVCEVEMQSDGILQDFDNPESLRRLD